LICNNARRAGAQFLQLPLPLWAVLTAVFELNGLPLRLTALEWRVLACLTLRKNVVVERSELNEKVYEGDADVDSNSLEVIVARLRRKIGREMIETVRGRGYRLTCGNP
jgi:two-component system OmpR family response regulator